PLPGVERRLRRSLRTRSGVADRHAEISAAGGLDDHARYHAGHGGTAEGGRSRSVRTGSGATRSGARKLSPPGRRAGLAGSRWGALEGGDRPRCDQRRRFATRAAVSARTSRAPHALSTRAQASSVAPVVLTSSTRTTTSPGISRHSLPGAKAPFTLPWRLLSGRSA